MALVPQELSLNSNRTLDPSACLGLQVGSSRVVLSGCTVGQVAAGDVTTVMVPSAEQTDTRREMLGRSPTQRGEQSGSEVVQVTRHVLCFEEAAFRGGRLDLQSFGVSQKKLKCSIKV